MDANAFKNVTSVSITPAGGASVPLTSVTQIMVNDATDQMQAGSDNDSSFTLVYNRGLKCTGVLGFTDTNQALLCSNINGDIFYTEVALRGSNIAMVVFNAQTGNLGSQGQWQELRGHPVAFTGGRHGKVGAAS